MPFAQHVLADRSPDAQCCPTNGLSSSGPTICAVCNNTYADASYVERYILSVWPRQN